MADDTSYLNCPAFPTQSGMGGLTKREYVAIQIMAALLSQPDLTQVNRWQLAADALRGSEALLSVLDNPSKHGL